MNFDTTTYRLSDAINIIGGGTPKRSNPCFWGGEIPWLSVVDFNTNSRFVENTVEKITQEGLDRSSTKLLEKGQLIISARGTVGCLAQLTKPMAFNQSCYGLDGKEGIIENDLLYYLMKLKIADLKQKTHGAVFDTITRETFNHIDIDIPNDPNVRRKIAKILGNLDKKIAINSKANQTLENIAQSIFKSWFVDFEPVRAKMAVLDAGGTAEQADFAAMSAISAKGETALKQLHADQPEAYAELAQTAALFPSVMEESELGKIPKGWEVKTLSEMTILTGGGTPKRSIPSYWNGDIPWFSVKDIPKDGNVFVIDTEEKITALGLKKSSTKLLKKGTTIITARGTVGKLALLATDMCMNQSCYGVNGKGTGPYFNYFYLREAVATLKRNTHGAVFDTITTNTFDTYRASFCGEVLAKQFEKSVTPLLEGIENNLWEDTPLGSIRDSLLPKLLSGALPITNTEVS